MGSADLPPLPVDEVLPELLSALRGGGAAALVAPTGAGKTTRVPPAIEDAGLGGVLVLEPRRLAARAAARRIATERGSRVGEEVGYAVRFDRRAGPRTRILVATEGVVVRRLQDDPFLEGVGCVVFDEFHERHLDADLALAMVRRVRAEVRPDLALVVMSATLDAEPVAAFLGDCPIVRSEGRLHPVDVEYLPARGRERTGELVGRGVRRALERTDGDLLAFLPGVGEIRRAGEAVAGMTRQAGIEVHELYGDLPPERQDAVLGRSDRRKLVLATNVAESSVTIEGVTGVVDTGLARVPRFDAGVGLDRLELSRISLASAEQRTGRAGRTAPGVCVRLWSEMDQRALAPREEPEVRRVDLARAVLELLVWGESDPAAFPWFEPPRQEAVESSLELLGRLGAISDSGATDLGRSLARIPAHPRLARLLLEGHRLGSPERAALAAAILSERDPFRGSDSAALRGSDSDVLERVWALEDFERAGVADRVSPGSARFILRARDQLLRIADRAFRDLPSAGAPEDETLGRALLAAFPDRLARRRERGSDRGVMVGGRGVRLAESSVVTEAELFVCVDVDAGRAEALVRQASAVERDWVDGGRTHERVVTFFDEDRERVVARKESRLGELSMAAVDHPVTDVGEAERVLVHAARRALPRALALDDDAVASFLARVGWLRDEVPELDLPVFDDAAIAELLPELAHGRRSFADLRKAPLLQALRSRLTHDQAAALERDAPERLPVPSGSRIRLAYEPGRPPVLAARIQQLFGLAATPRVARGRVPVLLHLLAPNGRPQQVTDDLESFWSTTYSVVRKELRRRYPKHAWPEDPRTATPEHRPGGGK